MLYYWNRRVFRKRLVLRSMVTLTKTFMFLSRASSSYQSRIRQSVSKGVQTYKSLHSEIVTMSSPTKPRMEIFDSLRLFTTEEKMLILPSAFPRSCLTIDRVTEEFKVESSDWKIPLDSKETIIYGLLGSVQLIGCTYLMVVAERTKVGETSGHAIWKMSKSEFISLNKSNTHLSTEQQRLNNEYLYMLQNAVQLNTFYFSYSYDLSHSLQRLYHLPPDTLANPMHQRGEQKYIWNEYLLSRLSHVPGISSYLLPVINGFVAVESCVVNGHPFRFILISRRDKSRAGLRLFTRGIDSNGNVANFVESEMIVETRNERASFVQTRGSMPFFWQQWPNLKYKPKPAVIQNENHLDAFNRHFEAQQVEYGRQILVNLIDHKGSEGKLEEFYKELVVQSGNPNIKYEAFDFHCECSKMRWHRLDILIDRVAHDLEEMGFLLAVNDKVLSYQEGVFRTNCVDCLDRTNVVQSMLARRSLETILTKLNILQSGDLIKNHSGLESVFRNVWTDNADAISTQYSGTGALKTDYTRTGKRSHAGMLQDLTRSILRYYRNNLCQGSLQDGTDLLLGRYRVSPSEGLTSNSPLNVVKSWKVTTFTLVFLIAIAMFFANLITPAEYETGTFLSLMFWGSMIGFTAATILQNGKDFIDYPKLTTKMPGSSSRA